ncbi:MAG: hypothetical protein HYZ21_15725 [Chloroflexi bacterium]|nr:hypothetical protein [Chloroflexota bacterium]
MQRIEKEAAIAALANRQSLGLHVDSRLLEKIKSDCSLYLLQLKDEKSFLSLIWQEIDATRILTPTKEPRTLFDVATRLIKSGYTFEGLNKDLGLGRNQHQPEWFSSCITIDAEFDFTQFGWIALVAATDNERTQSPNGSFYIFDGVHKTLVLAKRLLTEETTFQPIEALFLAPR